jgi:hypothetical protein
MIADEFRTLCSRREGTFLDFKERFYENSDAGTAELAKDVMSIANGLGLQACGHILFGVREEPDGTGTIVGCELDAWVADANLQQKVRSCLNRVPQFGLSILTVEDLRVAAIEIHPGGRPFFALRDKGRLRRHHAFIRIGSSTDIASPDEILDWARQDESLGLRALEAEHLETQQLLKPRLQRESRSQGGESYGFNLCLYNDGIAPFEPVSALLRWSPQSEKLRSVLAENHVRLLQAPPDLDEAVPICAGTVSSRSYCGINVSVDRVESASKLFQHLRPFLEGDVSDAIRMQILNAFSATAIVHCCNLLGTREIDVGVQLHFFT